MEPKEFLERYLPEYKLRLSASSLYNIPFGVAKSIGDSFLDRHVCAFNKANFPEALKTLWTYMGKNSGKIAQ